MTEIFWKSYVKIFYILKTHKDDEHGNAENKFFVLQKRVQVNHTFIMLLLIRMVILKKCIQDMPVMLLKMIIILR